MVNGAGQGQGQKAPKRLPKKTIRALAPGARGLPRPVNIAQSLRRIRSELSLMLSAVDDGLHRIEANECPRNRFLETSQKGDFENGGRSSEV